MASEISPEVPWDVLPHVYAFLVQKNFKKTATSFRKECGTVRTRGREERAIVECKHRTPLIIGHHKVIGKRCRPYLN